MSDGPIRCDVCREAAVVFVPGDDGVRELFVLVRPVPEQRWCLPCARLAGWPWVKSEASSLRYMVPA